MSKNYRPWTAADVAQLRELYGTMPNAELARLTKRYAENLSRKARSIGLGSPRSSPLLSELLTHISAAAPTGLSIAQLGTFFVNYTQRALARALANGMEAGQVHRHRHYAADLYYTSAEACAAGTARLRKERAAATKRNQAAHSAKRYAERLAAEGRSQSRTHYSKPATPALPHAPKRNQPAPRRPKPKARDARPGAQQIVVLKGTAAPVRLPAMRGPAHLPGKPITPPGLRVQRAPVAADTRYTAQPGAYGLGLAKQRPGQYSEPARPWAAAAIANSASPGNGA